MASIFPGVELCTDVSPAEWVRAGLRAWRPFPVRVATLVPATYPAHARVLHTAYWGERRVAWSEIAAETGRALNAHTVYNELVGWDLRVDDQAPPEPWNEPEPGTMSKEQCEIVATLLGRNTTTPDDCWFAVWEGYGWTDIDRRAPRVRLENRECLLYRGPITAAATAFASDYGLFQSPTLWWPEDRAWCVASELDIYSTYIGATRATVAALVECPDLEVFECDANDAVDPSPNYGPRKPDPPSDPVPPGAYPAAFNPERDA